MCTGSHSSILIKRGYRVAQRLPRHVLSLTLEHAPAFNASTSPDIKRIFRGWREELIQVTQFSSFIKVKTYLIIVVFVANGVTSEGNNSQFVSVFLEDSRVSHVRPVYSSVIVIILKEWKNPLCCDAETQLIMRFM